MTSLDWTTNWDPDVGLWRLKNPGNDASVAEYPYVHAGTEATTKLLIAASAGCLDQVDVHAVLTALREMQNLDGGEKYGRFKWYLENPDFTGDEHVLFFNGLTLLTVWGVYRNDLDEPSRALLADILKDAFVYNLRRVKHGNLYYPNEYLGELVCTWLGMEFFDKTDARNEVTRLLDRELTYLQEHHWGWGEHVSDHYAKICIDELSLLLLLSQDLPDDLRTKAIKLLKQLMDLEDLFEDGPIVPAIRSYTFTQIPTGLYYRDTVQPIPPGATLEPYEGQGSHLPSHSAPLVTTEGSVWMPLGHTLHVLGWHKLVGKKKNSPARGTKTIPCVDGVSAAAYLDDDVRLGSLSRFPLMPTAENISWGLAWQSYPAVLWQRDRLWSYLQWETLEAGQRVCHPARQKFHPARLRTLTTSINPPVFGWTYAKQQDGELLALRIMPAMPKTWEELADRFRIIHNPDLKIVSESTEGDWSQLVLESGGRMIALQCVRLNSGPAPTTQSTDDHILDWSVCYDADALKGRRTAVNLWGVSLSGPVEAPPVITPDPQAPPIPRATDVPMRLVQWNWPSCSWNLRINPRNPHPLQYIDE